MHGICICVFITRSACTSCTLLSYICYRSNLSTKVCQQEVGHCTELERERVACSTAPPAAPAATSSLTAPAYGMPNTVPFPNPWTGTLAGQGIIIPPQLALAGPAGTGTMGAVSGFGALAGHPFHRESAFQFGMQFSQMQQQCLQMSQRMDMMQASTMQDSSKPT